MDCLCPGPKSGCDDRIAAQIAFGRLRPADVNCLVRHGDMARGGVRIGIDRDRGHAQPPAGIDHPAGDFATVGDQYLAKHGHIIRPEISPPEA